MSTFDKYQTFRFIVKQIKELKITPAQIALDPCSGSVVITDPRNGDVRAMVTYPSYDNNKMANKVDSEYYNKKLIENCTNFSAIFFFCDN